MKKKLATGVALALVCLPAMAEFELEPGFYAGVGVGEVTLKDSVAGLDIEATGTGYRMFGGYRFNEYGSIEASYNAGTPEDTVFGVNVESDATSFQGSLLWQVPIGNRFEMYARGSIIAWEAENTATIGRTTVRQDNDGTDFGYGIGAAVHVTPKLGIRAEFEGAELDGTDVRALSIAGLFRF